MIEEAPLRLDTPLLAQVSRWDRLKDPLGVLAGFVEYVEADEEPQLVLAGPDVTAVTDDPEGAEVLAEVDGGLAGVAAGATGDGCTSRCCRWPIPTRTRSWSTRCSDVPTSSRR